MLHRGGSAEIVSRLIEAEADVNDRFTTPVCSVLGVMLRTLSLRHAWRTSALSAYAYHHFGATPLMSSILTGTFEVTAILLGTGASTELRNARGRTAWDLAVETAAPDYVVSALEGKGDAYDSLVLAFADIVREIGFISEEL
ncbi:unnamed protein product [Symbiodinium pilosum]|uniref:Uncharacterized protein n=1 Tax=Symbiodinium pilosum TaxID=2952 RepID=A0A812T227_SYMPI|nr:unnamed protein product [Symbiodinium pilosum]